MFYDKNKIYIAFILICIIVIGIIYSVYRENNTNYIVDGNHIVLNTPPISSTEETDINYNLLTESYRVFISGEVVNSDVYEVDPNDRIIDLLEMAGGPTENADLNRVNLADFLSDAQHVIIPTIIEVGSEEYLASVSENNYGQNSDINLVNINTASLNELTTLPGVGSVIAQNIINYREQNGQFSSIEELQKVNRIGVNTFENLKDFITI